eukprot:6472008-Amphidinium_carterae.1
MALLRDKKKEMTVLQSSRYLKYVALCDMGFSSEIWDKVSEVPRDAFMLLILIEMGRNVTACAWSSKRMHHKLGEVA